MKRLQETWKRLALTLGLSLAWAALVAADAPSPQAQVKLLFSGPQDVADTWGKLHFGATALQKVRDCANPGFVLAFCMPDENGAWGVYGQIYQDDRQSKEEERKNVWKIVRATTHDGEKYENLETVFTSEPARWTDHLAIAYNSDGKEFLALRLKVDQSGFAYRAFFSPDGRAWKEHPQTLFYDGDAMSLFWSPVAKRFVVVSKTLQPVAKHLRDHGGTTPSLNNDNLLDRRVLSIRSSRDGRVWEPSDSMLDVWNRGGQKKARPVELMTLPDDQDPPDLEFYSGNGFWYHDRAYMMVLNYAASPLGFRKHGPQLDTEWWVSRDGLKWERPYRGLNASGAEVTRPAHNPMVAGGQTLLHYGNRILAMKQDRISFVSARANGEFSTVPFTMPQGDLCLNAAIPSPERPFGTQQAYVMAAVLDEQGKAVPGFEAEKCVLQNADKIDLPLRWGEKSARELAGRSIRLRFYLRSANIYAVTSQ